MIPATQQFAVTSSSRRRKPGHSKLRARIAAAFAKFANAVDARTANSRTHAFYRSSGGEWTRAFMSIGGAND